MTKANDISDARPGWCKWLSENPYPRTKQQIAYFRRTFPDAKGEVLMMMILWPMEMARAKAMGRIK